MKEGGAKLAGVLEKLLATAEPGVTLLEIDARAKELIKKAGGTPSFQTVSGYTWATCLCVNDVIVHGVPTKYVLRAGDVLTVDVGLLYKGLHTDTAWTKIVGEPEAQAEPKVKTFLRVGEKALWDAIAQAQVGNRIGHISHAIQTSIEEAGYSVMRTLIGHGIGTELHEAPQVPGFVSGSIAKTMELKSGMTLAIEAIYAMGKKDVIYETGDGWSIATKDGSLAAVFEHTIAVTPEGPVLLTTVGN